MSVDLPEPIAAYFAAENGHDTGALERCFTEDAVVRDEGQTFKGLADIKQWKAETKKKYQHTVEPLEAVQKDGETIVTNRLTGNFPGSPIDLRPRPQEHTTERAGPATEAIRRAQSVRSLHHEIGPRLPSGRHRRTPYAPRLDRLPSDLAALRAAPVVRRCSPAFEAA